ncbi:TniB family NTP-binding protein [Mesorhizobium sp.]|uniref:TniB family NTP-binding protein n=1 Tax=Mesorhizobium sp. TaxID=1871066 RepID=UPI00343F7F8B
MPGTMLVGPYANGKMMIAERFVVEHLKAAEQQRVRRVMAPDLPILMEASCRRCVLRPERRP